MDLSDFELPKTLNVNPFDHKGLPTHQKDKKQKAGEIDSKNKKIFIAQNATLIGNVILGADSSVWYNAVIRADLRDIMLGISTNVQDGAILHVTNTQGCILGDYVTIGHGAIVHAATVGDGSLVGMNATVLSGAIVGKGSIVAAGALVKEGAMFPPFSLIGGVPAKVLKMLPENTLEKNILLAKKYVKLKNKYLEVHPQD